MSPSQGSSLDIEALSGIFGWVIVTCTSFAQPLWHFVQVDFNRMLGRSLFPANHWKFPSVVCRRPVSHFCHHMARRRCFQHPRSRLAGGSSHNHNLSGVLHLRGYGSPGPMLLLSGVYVFRCVDHGSSIGWPRGSGGWCYRRVAIVVARNIKRCQLLSSTHSQKRRHNSWVLEFFGLCETCGCHTSISNDAAYSYIKPHQSLIAVASCPICILQHMCPLCGLFNWYHRLVPVFSIFQW